MDREFVLLLRGAIIGLLSTAILELVKHHLEKKREAQQAIQASRKKRAESIAKFLRGDRISTPSTPIPYPAWLRQVTAARRNPLARLGLRRDEDYATDIYRIQRMNKKRDSAQQQQTLSPAHPHSQKYILGPMHVIGRGSKCDIQILDPTISLIHALIRFEGDHFVLYDLGSTSGTRVDGKPVSEMGVTLKGGEKILMGETTFEFGRVLNTGELDRMDSFLMV